MNFIAPDPLDRIASECQSLQGAFPSDVLALVEVARAALLECFYDDEPGLAKLHGHERCKGLRAALARLEQPA